MHSPTFLVPFLRKVKHYVDILRNVPISSHKDFWSFCKCNVEVFFCICLQVHCLVSAGVVAFLTAQYVSSYFSEYLFLNFLKPLLL